MLRRGASRPTFSDHEESELTDQLCLLVEIHELAHGLCHRGRTQDGQGFENADKASVIVHELWAQELVRWLALRHGAPELVELLHELSQEQSVEYRAYRLLDGLDDAVVRRVLLKARQGTWPSPMGEIVEEVRSVVERVLEQTPLEEAPRLRQALQALASVKHVDPLVKMECHEAFLEVVRTPEVERRLTRPLPSSEALVMHKLAQLVTWFPG